MKYKVLAALAFSLIVSPGRAQQPAQLPAAAALMIPFQPPVGRELRYRITSVVEKGETKAEGAAVFTYRFEPATYGYRLFVTPPAQDTLKFGDLVAGMAHTIMKRPHVLRVSNKGEIIGLEDERAYWDGIRKDVSDSKLFLEYLSDTPAKERRDLLAWRVTALLEFANRQMQLGKVEERREKEAGRIRTQLHSANSENARIREIIRRTDDPGKALGIPLKIEIQTVTDYDVSRSEGIVTKYTSVDEKRASFSVIRVTETTERI